MSADHRVCATSEVMEEELARVLASTDFLASTHLTRFLEFVVHEALAGREDRIKERTIARRALGRDADFDPRLDCIVRVVAGRLRRALDRYYSQEGSRNAIKIEIPKGGYRPVFRRADGVTKVNTQPAKTPQTGRIATNALNPIGYPVVAVVPFVTFTQNEQERFIADSIAADVSVRLSRFSWFQVIDYFAARSLRTKSYVPHEAAARLRADYFVTGTVRRNADGHRVTASLAHTGNAVTIWAGEFEITSPDGEGDEVDAIVERIVVTVGDLFGELNGAVWSASQRKSIDELTAVEAVVLQRHYLTQLSDETYGRALKAVTRTVRDHPNFAWGWAALANLHTDDLAYHFRGGRAESAERCRQCLRQALAIDPTCSYTHWVAGLHAFFQGHIEEMINSTEKTLEYASGAPALTGGVGTIMSIVGEVETGQPMVERALRANPRLPGWVHWSTAFQQMHEGDFRGAVATSSSICMPGNFWDPMIRAMVVRGTGSEANRLVERAIRIRPELAVRPRELGGRIIKQPALLDQFVDCVRAAGR